MRKSNYSYTPTNRPSAWRDAATISKKAIRIIYPKIPEDEAESIAVNATQPGSGRVIDMYFRKVYTKPFPDAVMTAVKAHIRHQHTPYDEHLSEHGKRGYSRFLVNDHVNRIEKQWGKR